jgi:hypothetical protein
MDDVDQAEAHFDLFGHSFNLCARSVHGFASNVTRAWKSVWAHPMVLFGYVCQVETRFCPFRDSVI